MAEKYELAEQDYMNGMKYKDIAEKYDVSINTVKSWKTRYKWSKDAAKKGMHTKQKGVHTKKESAPVQKEVVESVEVIELENDDFTDKQRIFISYYVKYWNATKAYQKAYACAYSTAMVEGSRLLRNPKIREEIVRVRDGLTEDALLDKRTLIQKWIDIAFADITDYVQFGRVEEIVYNDDGEPELDMNGNIKTWTRNFVNLNESTEIDGSLITEVKQGKDGTAVKLADKMKALEFLSKHMDLLNERELKQLQAEKMRIEVETVRKSNEKQSSTITIVDAWAGEDDE